MAAVCSAFMWEAVSMPHPRMLEESEQLHKHPVGICSLVSEGFTDNLR